MCKSKTMKVQTSTLVQERARKRIEQLKSLGIENNGGDAYVGTTHKTIDFVFNTTEIYTDPPDIWDKKIKKVINASHE